MNILRTTNTNKKWTRALRLAVACCMGALALGISAFSLQLAAQSAADLGRFSGIRETKYKGRTFFTLNLKVTDGVLGGTAVHCTRVAWVYGELIPSSDETTTEKILEAHASGQKLMIKTADGSCESDPISLEFNLTAKDKADAKLTLEKKVQQEFLRHADIQTTLMFILRQFPPIKGRPKAR